MQLHIWTNKGLVRAGVQCGGREAVDDPLFHLVIIWDVFNRQLFWPWMRKSAWFTAVWLCLDF